jgi:chromosome segregation ATPase
MVVLWERIKRMCCCCESKEIHELRKIILESVMEINKRLNVLQDGQDNLKDFMADRFDGVNADFDALAASASALTDTVNKIGADVSRLDDQIAALTAGQVTDAQIADLQAKSSALVSKFDAIKSAADAVDALTPEPVEPPPVEPPV